MVSEAFLQELVDGIAGADPDERVKWADTVTDVAGSLSPQGVDRVARALATAAASEPDEDCLEAQLHALDDLTVHHPVEREILVPVLAIDRTDLQESEREYLDALQSYYDGRPV